MIAKALDSGWAEMIYEDQDARILRIRDVKGEPPNDADEDTSPETDEEKRILDEEERNAAKNRNVNPDEDELEN